VSRLLPLATCAILLAAAIQGPAAQAAECYGMPPLSIDGAATPRLQVVLPGAARVPFVGGSAIDPACPAPIARCTRKAFVVPGDPVIVTAISGAYACATFTSPTPKAAVTVGWLPRAALGEAERDATARRPAEWAGTWRSGPEQEIHIQSGDGARIVITGDATFGGSDPERVRRGAVNVGEIAGTVTVQNGTAAFAIGEDGATHAFDIKGSEGADLCRVRLWRLGHYLIAADNMMCGGMNVTFTGVYRRADR
jgi:hypothetical protein